MYVVPPHRFYDHSLSRQELKRICERDASDQPLNEDGGGRDYLGKLEHLKSVTIFTHQKKPNQPDPQYRSVGRNIIEKCFDSQQALEEFFDQVCDDFKSGITFDDTYLFGMIVHVLLATSSIQSADQLDEFIVTRFRESLSDIPHSFKYLIDAMKLFDTNDIALTEGRCFLEALTLKAVRLHAVDEYDPKTHSIDSHVALIEPFLDRSPSSVDVIFDQIIAILDILPHRVPDLDKSEVPDLIAALLVGVSKISHTIREDVYNYLDSLIAGEVDFEAELAGYVYAMIERSIPGQQSYILERLEEGFLEATDEEKEFWTIALAEFSSYEFSAARRSFELINKFLQESSSSANEASVGYASEALAKLVNVLGREELIKSSGIGGIAERVTLHTEPNFQITNRQLIIYVSKVIAALDRDNYKSVLNEVEHFLLSIQASPLFDEAKEVLFESLYRAVEYCPELVHQEVIERVTNAISDGFIEPVVAELYASLLSGSLPSCIAPDSERLTYEYLRQYEDLNNLLEPFKGAGALSEVCISQIEFLKLKLIDDLEVTLKGFEL